MKNWKKLKKKFKKKKKQTNRTCKSIFQYKGTLRNSMQRTTPSPPVWKPAPPVFLRTENSRNNTGYRFSNTSGSAKLRPAQDLASNTSNPSICHMRLNCIFTIPCGASAWSACYSFVVSEQALLLQHRRQGRKDMLADPTKQHRYVRKLLFCFLRHTHSLTLTQRARGANKQFSELLS